MNKNIVTIKYYEQQIRVELPTNYTNFVNCLSTMLSIPKDFIDNFSIFYYDSPNYGKHIIKNSEAYDSFLNAVKEKKVDKINIELSNDNENNINNIDKKKEEDDLFNNPYKESFYEVDNKINEEEDMKQNSDIILNNIEKENDYEAIEFSFLEEKKSSKDKNENELNINNNNINENNNKGNIKINNPNINVNYNTNSYYGQNKLVDNQIRGAPVSMNFNIKCNFCQKNQMVTVFYCKNCSIFFCTDCEKKIGKNHQHCYYKIRNKEQFEEICKIHNNNNNKIKNVYGNYNNNINNNNSINSETIETKLNEFFSEGTKLIENTFNSVVNLFSTSNNQNNPQFNNNNNINNRNNNYAMNNNNNNNNLVNNRNDNNIKILVNKAKSQYNLGQIDDKEIEKALIVCKGNIDKAVALLLSSHSL